MDSLLNSLPRRRGNAIGKLDENGGRIQFSNFDIDLANVVPELYIEANNNKGGSLAFCERGWTNLQFIFV